MLDYQLGTLESTARISSLSIRTLENTARIASLLVPRTSKYCQKRLLGRIASLSIRTLENTANIDILIIRNTRIFITKINKNKQPRLIDY